MDDSDLLQNCIDAIRAWYPGVRRALEQELGVKILASPLCQLNGAYGAAIHGWNKIKE